MLESQNALQAASIAAGFVSIFSDFDTCRLCLQCVKLACLYFHWIPMRGDIATFASVAIILLLCKTQTSHLRLFDVLISSTYYFGAVIFATSLWRISPFHPLTRFPGPLLNKITSLHLAYMAYSGRRHLIMERLHQRYGKFVRTGKPFHYWFSSDPSN